MDMCVSNKLFLISPILFLLSCSSYDDECALEREKEFLNDYNLVCKNKNIAKIKNSGRSLQIIFFEANKKINIYSDNEIILVSEDEKLLLSYDYSRTNKHVSILYNNFDYIDWGIDGDYDARISQSNYKNSEIKVDERWLKVDKGCIYDKGRLMKVVLDKESYNYHIDGKCDK